MSRSTYNCEKDASKEHTYFDMDCVFCELDKRIDEQSTTEDLLINELADNLNRVCAIIRMVTGALEINIEETSLMLSKGDEQLSRVTIADALSSADTALAKIKEQE